MIKDLRNIWASLIGFSYETYVLAGVKTSPSSSAWRRTKRSLRKFLAHAGSDRADVIQETAANMQLHTTPVEKDFWVCYILRELFALDCVKDQLIFKGGTSLSKGYGITEQDPLV